MVSKKEAHKIWSRTTKGVISTLYSGQKTSSKKRGVRSPEYTKEEFSNWLLSQPKFHELLSEWRLSGYVKRLKPSVDRTNLHPSG